MSKICDNIILWFRTIRPQTLLLSLIPVFVAIIVVDKSGIPINIMTAVLTASCAVSLQILSNLTNDYYDFLKGADKAGRVGYKRAMAEGSITVSAMRRACLIAAFIACLLGLPLVLLGGWVILAIGLTALLFAWLYTATSHSLAYLGIADIFVFLYYGVIASGGTTYLLLSSNECNMEMAGMISAPINPLIVKSCYAGAVCGLISMCVLMINNLRDIQDDIPVGKRTIPVRIGCRGAECIMFIYILLMPCFSVLAFGWDLPALIFFPACALWRVTIKAEGTKYNHCLLYAVLVNIAYFVLCTML
ncbi:1,4-dihydroxy-2-naphthoate octaprenyltransferase [Prevotella sp. PINT]|jgi:1,4-dihydroxy-2-naphthoate octaprenyltransferase|uniref:1,4-dihydroxy-2-naphthoate octaprenyltransferase n=1 Tax=Palleniella intestinalis TaxID=2736291 RepID=UPI0015534335|nr:1,4-dihydroxy-2-naphthoate octaprenyltransferase [Palleniella intestinalis]NPD80482.1 1,4-dihydroxy-2-naphthoate octaprenyltransferase [Palleniella intestinalis]